MAETPLNPSTVFDGIPLNGVQFTLQIAGGDTSPPDPSSTGPQTQESVIVATALLWVDRGGNLRMSQGMRVTKLTTSNVGGQPAWRLTFAPEIQPTEHQVTFLAQASILGTTLLLSPAQVRTRVVATSPQLVMDVYMVAAGNPGPPPGASGLSWLFGGTLNGVGVGIAQGVMANGGTPDPVLATPQGYLLDFAPSNVRLRINALVNSMASQTTVQILKDGVAVPGLFTTFAAGVTGKTNANFAAPALNANDGFDVQLSNTAGGGGNSFVCTVSAIISP